MAAAEPLPNDESPEPSAREIIVALIDQMVPASGSFIPSELAHQLYDYLIRKYPEALDAWLHEIAVETLTEHFSRRLRSLRTLSRLNAKKELFGELVEAGDMEGLVSQFSVVYEVGKDHTRKRVRDMTGADHLYVANHYGERARNFSLLQAFHAAIAERVGRRRTEEVLSEQQYAEMYKQIVLH